MTVSDVFVGVTGDEIDDGPELRRAGWLFLGCRTFAAISGEVTTLTSVDAAADDEAAADNLSAKAESDLCLIGFSFVCQSLHLIKPQTYKGLLKPLCPLLG